MGARVERWAGPVLAGLVTYLIPVVAGILHHLGGCC